MTKGYGEYSRPPSSVCIDAVLKPTPRLSVKTNEFHCMEAARPPPSGTAASIIACCWLLWSLRVGSDSSWTTVALYCSRALVRIPARVVSTSARPLQVKVFKFLSMTMTAGIVLPPRCRSTRSGADWVS